MNFLFSLDEERALCLNLHRIWDCSLSKLLSREVQVDKSRIYMICHLFDRKGTFPIIEKKLSGNFLFFTSNFSFFQIFSTKSLNCPLAAKFKIKIFVRGSLPLHIPNVRNLTFHKSC